MEPAAEEGEPACIPLYQKEWLTSKWGQLVEAGVAGLEARGRPNLRGCTVDRVELALIDEMLCSIWEEGDPEPDLA